jgi:hypothetical protein
MLELSKQQNFQLKSNVNDDFTSMSVVLLSSLLKSEPMYVAGPAQFGYKLRSNPGVFGRLLLANPIDGCKTLEFPLNVNYIFDKILVVKRGNCMFIDKVRLAEKAGALGVIVIDNVDESSSTTSPFFAMSGDGIQNVQIPSVFIFGKDGNDLLKNMLTDSDIIAFIGDNSIKNNLNGMERSLYFNTNQIKNLFKPFIKNDNCLLFDHLNEIFTYGQISNNQECLKSDEDVIQIFNELIHPKQDKHDLTYNDAIESSEKLKILNIDDSIKLVILDNLKRHLFIDLSILEPKTKPNLTEHEYTQKIFETLYARLEKKTNILLLKNSDLYSKTLFNYVNSKLNSHLAGNSFTSQDKIHFKMLTNELDLK